MAPRDPERRSTLRLVTFNMWVGNRDPRQNLMALAFDTNRPHVIALQEARRFNGTIPGYERHDVDEPGNPESDNCVLLIRKEGVQVKRERDIDVKGPAWIGPKHGLKHPPRDFPGITVEVDGQRWDVVNVHRSWTGGLRHNMGSWTAEHRALVSFADRRAQFAPNRPLAFVGDWNGRRSDPRRFAMRDLNKSIGGRLLLKGIDGALVRGCRGRARRLDEKYGSDAHKPVEITLTATKEK